ncbi:hypothetical protein LCGC14_1306340 [marine sediment metagenome]|uniref:Uncharacterized protein n=1 Tax=marine sediment metagenome TaxID=412755 RepID=A0A0F9KNL9_9ZZZZ
MNTYQAGRLREGDHIRCRHNLGQGTVLRILWNERDRGPTFTRYPMVEFLDDVTGAHKWCVYLVIGSHIHRPRSRQ